MKRVLPWMVCVATLALSCALLIHGSSVSNDDVFAIGVFGVAASCMAMLVVFGKWLYKRLRRLQVADVAVRPIRSRVRTMITKKIRPWMIVVACVLSWGLFTYAASGEYREDRPEALMWIGFVGVLGFSIALLVIHIRGGSKRRRVQTPSVLDEPVDLSVKGAVHQPVDPDLVETVWEQCRRGDHEAALLALHNALKRGSDSVPLYLELASVYDDAQNSEKTIEFCARALRIDSENSRACELMGSAYTRRGQWDKAVSSLIKSLTLAPASERAYELLGRLVLEAVLSVPSSDLQAALDNPIVRVHCGPIVIRPELRAGIEYYQKGCTGKRQYLRVYYRMGMLYYHADKPEALHDRIRAAAKGGYGPAHEWVQELDTPPQQGEVAPGGAQQLEAIGLPLSDEWRSRLGEGSAWHGIQQVVVSTSREEVLGCIFDHVLPVLAPCTRRELDLAFPELQKAWGSDYLIETEPELIRDTVGDNLRRDSAKPGFSTFDVIVGTEATDESQLSWIIRGREEDYRALLQCKFVQANSIIGGVFRGYRIWKPSDEWGHVHIALAAAGGSVLL